MHLMKCSAKPLESFEASKSSQFIALPIEFIHTKKYHIPHSSIILHICTYFELAFCIRTPYIDFTSNHRSRRRQSADIIDRRWTRIFLRRLGKYAGKNLLPVESESTNNEPAPRPNNRWFVNYFRGCELIHSSWDNPTGLCVDLYVGWKCSKILNKSRCVCIISMCVCRDGG